MEIGNMIRVLEAKTLDNKSAFIIQPQSISYITVDDDTGKVLLHMSDGTILNYPGTQEELEKWLKRTAS